MEGAAVLPSEDELKRDVDCERQSRVEQLADQWRACQTELARLRRVQDKRLMADDADSQEFFELADLEDGLRRKSKALVKAMVETPSETADDVICKLNIWRDVKCPRGTQVSGKTLYNHLAVSALDDASTMRQRCADD